MTSYEFMFILSPELSDADRDAQVADVKKVFTKAKAKVSKEDIMGKKILAYKINKQKEGIYVLFELELDGKKIKEISKSLNLMDNILRYMFTKV